MSESKIQRDCRDIAEAQGWHTEKVNSESRVGWPDVLFMRRKNGYETRPNFHAFLVEFKDPKGVVSPKQKNCHKELSEKGMKVLVIDNVENFKTELSLVMFNLEGGY